MTVSNSTSRADYTGNGVTVAFTIPFYFLDTSHVKVVRRTISSGTEQTLALTTDYTVTGAGSGSGGTLTMLAAPTADQKITVVRNVPQSQQTHYVPNDPFPAASHEMALDKLTMLIQQIYETLGRAVLSASTESPGPSALPLIAARANKFLGFDAAGNPVAFSGTGTDTALRTDLASVVAGALLVAFKAAGTSAATRTLAAKVGEICLSVADFFVAGAADDYLRFQAAINQAVATGMPLYVPPGNYNVGTALSVTGALTMYGAGDQMTAIVATSPTQDLFSVATDSPMVWRDFDLVGHSSATAGALIRLSGSASQNLYSSFTNIRFQNGWDQLRTVKAAAFSCYFCKFFSPWNVGLTLENDFNVDGGDMGVVNCDFIGGSRGVAVQQFSAGGLRLIGCKVVQWAIGYQCSLLATVNTSDLFIVGCSFESQSTAHIIIGKGAGAGFGAVHIGFNEINNAPFGIELSTDSGPWLNIVNIAHNEIANTTNISILVQGTQNFILADNILSGSGIGINIGTVVSDGSIHGNRLSGFGTPIAGTLTGKNLTVRDNPGYNPVGASALAPGASPWTYTNGPSPTDLYLNASTQVTAVTVNGGAILPAAVVNFFMRLGPNEVAVITYTGVLTGKQMVH